MLGNTIYLLGVALLFTHELDAIKHHEWRLFAFLINPLGDKMAYRVFTLVHVPLFFLFMWMVAYPRLNFEIAVDLFLIVHVGLHYLFRNHPSYEFSGWFSHGIIGGAGLMGALHLILIAIG